MSKLIVVTDFDYENDQIEKEIVSKAGFQFRSLQAKSETEIIQGALEAHTLITQYAYIGKECIDQLPNLKHIARYGVGTDIVDVAYATKKGIQVTNVPANYCLNEVADHAVALTLSFARGLKEYDTSTRKGVWKWQSASPLKRLADSTVGIVGMGNIGHAIATRMQAFGSKIVSFDPFAQEKGITIQGVTWVDFNALLAESDYIIIQAPLTPETVNMFNENSIFKMKDGAVLINTSRGPIVDTAAVSKALKSGKLSGAGFDDLPEEPSKKRDWVPKDGLFQEPKTIITPHAAYYSEQSIEFCRNYAATEAVLFAAGKEVRSPVNTIGAINE